MTLDILTNLFGLVSVPLPSDNALNNFNADPGGRTAIRSGELELIRSSTSQVDSMCGSATRITPTWVPCADVDRDNSVELSAGQSMARLA